MTTSGISITGMDATLRKLARLGKLESTLGPVLTRNQHMIQKKLQKYPPPPPGSKYVRTYKLRRSWTVQAPIFGGSHFRALVYADGSAKTRYGPYDFRVMDAKRQAWMHKGRWHTTDSVAKEVTADVLKDVQRAIDKELAK